MDYSGQQINNRQVQICELTESKSYTGIKQQDVCQCEGKKEELLKIYFFDTLNQNQPQLFDVPDDLCTSSNGTQMNKISISQDVVHNFVL